MSQSTVQSLENPTYGATSDRVIPAPETREVRTFIQPVGEPVEDDALHPRGGDPQGDALHI